MRRKPRRIGAHPVEHSTPGLRIRPLRIPKKHVGVFAKLRSQLHRKGRALTLHAAARQIMNQRRSGLRAKQWRGGKAYAGRRRHVIRQKTPRHRHAKSAGLSSKQMAQANYLQYGKRNW